MKTKIVENYHYLESGLEYVYIKKVRAINTSYSLSVNIPKVKEIHEKIVTLILKHNIPLRGKELRFIRKTLKIIQVDLSNLLGIAQSTLVTWESKELDQQIDSAHSYFLQQYFREKCGLSLIESSTLLKKKEEKNFKIAV